MGKNYLTFPMKVVGITQTYNGKTSHYNNSHGSPADFPIDIAGADTGRSAFFCPCDEMKVIQITGDITGKNHANGAWLVSTSEVDFADGTRDFVTIKFVHMNNSDFGKNGIHVGRVYKRGELIGYEGTSHATGNHIHMSAGKGGIKRFGWTKNSRGSWVITTTHGTAKPEALFFVDPLFTSIKNAKGLKFKELSKEDGVEVKVIAGAMNTKTTTAKLALRSVPSTKMPLGIRFFYIPKGEKVSIVAENVAEADGYTWDCVIYKDVLGFSANKYLKV